MQKPANCWPSQTRTDFTMKLDAHTFGAAPAAMYLVQVLNDSLKPLLARKASKVLTEYRHLVNEVVGSHLRTDEMTRRSFAKIITMIEAQIRTNVILDFPDPFIGDLLGNILLGELRVHKKNATRAAHLQQHIARGTPSGKTVISLKAVRVKSDRSEKERIEWLRKRSADYLTRKGKINTLY